MRLPNFNGSRDVFTFLLANFLDWCYRKNTLAYIDELILYLPPTYTEVCEESLIFFKELLVRPNPYGENIHGHKITYKELTPNEITRIRNFYESYDNNKNASVYGYLFSSDSVESYGLTVFLQCGFDVSLVQKDGVYLSDHFSYISTHQWRKIFSLGYDATSPSYASDAIDKLAMSVHIDPDPYVFTENEFIEILTKSSKRAHRPGLSLEEHLQIVDRETVNYKILLNLYNALRRVYPDSNADELREVAYYRKTSKDIVRCTEGLTAFKEIRFPKPGKNADGIATETLTDPESVRWEQIVDIINCIGMSEIPSYRLSAVEFIRKKVLQVILDIDVNFSWKRLMELAEVFSVKSVSSNRQQAIVDVQDHILIEFLKFDGLPEKVWTRLINIANVIGVVELSVDKAVAITEIENYMIDVSFQTKWRSLVGRRDEREKDGDRDKDKEKTKETIEKILSCVRDTETIVRDAEDSKKAEKEEDETTEETESMPEESTEEDEDD